MLTDLEVYSSLASAPNVPLPLGGADTDPIHIRDIQGLGPVKATVNMRAYGSQDGEFFTGSSVGKRNIVLTLGFSPDWATDTFTSLRERVYSYFMPKHPVKLRIFRDDLPTVEIEGYCESVEPNMFSKDPEMQISVLCPSPDFVATVSSKVEGVAKSGAVAVEFTALGNTYMPFVLEVKAGGAAPYDGLIRIETETLVPNITRKFQVVAPVSAAAYFYMNSSQGQKAAKTVQVSNGETANQLNSLTNDSQWPYLEPGTNRIKVVTASATGRPWTLTYFERFGGL